MQARETAHPEAPLVALVGRPNVGKSTLFNRLVRRRQALMHDQPGVTRDRLFASCMVEFGQQEHIVRLVDTGGLVDSRDDDMSAAMMAQTSAAIDEAALVLLVVDGRAGLSPFDKDAAQRLRSSKKPFAVVVNKLDMSMHNHLMSEFYSLGAQAMYGISAEHARGISELRRALGDMLSVQGHISAITERPKPMERQGPPPGGQWAAAENADDSEDDVMDEEEADRARAEGTVEWNGGSIQVAVVGRPNAGKSSLINAILAEERLVASEVAGTTRDAVDTEYERDGQSFVFIDTAGIRRSRSIHERLEALSVSMAVQSMERADVVVLMLHGAERPSDQDAKIAALAHDKGKGIVLVASQWDRVENPDWRENFAPAVRMDLSFVAYAPLVHTSAVTGEGLDELFAAIIAVQQERHRRISTGALNRFFREIIAHQPPPVRGGKRPILAFVSQPLVRPPTFIVAARRCESLGENYRRYLVRALRSRFGFQGTPLWVKFRAQHRKDSSHPGAR